MDLTLYALLKKEIEKAKLDSSNIDLSDYYTKEEISSKLENVESDITKLYNGEKELVSNYQALSNKIDTLETSIGNLLDEVNGEEV
jgi:hypothetical protein